MSDGLDEPSAAATPPPAPAAPELSVLLIHLLKGVIHREEDERLWASLLKLQARVREYAAVLLLELVLDEAEGHAFLKSRPEPDEADSAPRLPRLVPRRPLSYPVSLMLALLRKRMAEFDAGGGETRLVLSREDIAELMRVFLPTGSNEAKLIDQVDATITKVREWLQKRIDSEDKRLARLAERIINAMRGFQEAFKAESAEVDGVRADAGGAPARRPAALRGTLQGAAQRQHHQRDRQLQRAAGARARQHPRARRLHQSIAGGDRLQPRPVHPADRADQPGRRDPRVPAGPAQLHRGQPDRFGRRAVLGGQVSAGQFGLEWGAVRSRSFRFVVIDEAFGRGSDESAQYGLKLFQQLNLQLLIVTPLQKIHIIEPYVASVAFVHNEGGRNSRLRCLSIEEYRSERDAADRRSSAPAMP